MNTLAGSQVVAEDRLFATLDATTRLVSLAPGSDALLSDTVGFIRKLPHRLIESFKSTLDEVRESDLLIHVVSAIHVRYEDQIRVVHETLQEIGATDKPVLLAFNKVDALRYPDQLAALRATHPEGVFVSALRGTGMRTLKVRLLAMLHGTMVERTAYVPMHAGGVLSQIHGLASVVAQEPVMAQVRGRRPQWATRIRFRATRRDAETLRLALASLEELVPVEPGNDSSV